MRLPCGIGVTPGMTKSELLALPLVRNHIHYLAAKHSLAVYDRELRAGNPEPYWPATDDFTCTYMELESEVFVSVQDCINKIASSGAEEYLNESILQDLFCERGYYISDEDDYELISPGNHPHHAGDCTDCPHPNPASCRSCNALN